MLLIDAYNLLHAWRSNPAPSRRGADLIALAALLRRSEVRWGRVLLICDGAAPGDGGPALPGLELVYSGHAQSADDAITATLRRASGVRDATVVTSDRAVAAECRKLGASVIDSSVFLSRLVAAAARRPAHDKPMPALPLGDAETGVWLGYFGLKAEPVPRDVGKPPKRPARREASPGPPPPHDRTEPTSSEAWFDEAARVWPGLTVQDLMMDRWLRPATPRRG